MNRRPLMPIELSRAERSCPATKDDVDELAADVRYAWRELAVEVEKAAKKHAWFFIGFMMIHFALLLAVIYLLAERAI